jgi:hypothetical protein
VKIKKLNILFRGAVLVTSLFDERLAMKEARGHKFQKVPNDPKITAHLLKKEQNLNDSTFHLKLIKNSLIQHT